jgi:hypothetical protein
VKIHGYDPEYHLDLSGAGGVIASNYSRTSLGSNTPLADAGAGSVGSGPQAAPWDHVHPASGSSSFAFGSNSNDVSTANAGGASSSNSRADHVHRGLRSLAKAGSAALFGDVTLTGGTNVTLTQAGQDISIAASSSGGGLTQAYEGYNTIGGSTETDGVNSRVRAKSITLANDCLITSIGAYIKSAAGTVSIGGVALYTDSSGPDKVIAFSERTLMSTAANFRWVDMPLGAWVTAGTYWIAIRTTDLGGAQLAQIAYDGSGSDRTATGQPASWYDWAGWGAQATSSNRYSIRANTIR